MVLGDVAGGVEMLAVGEDEAGPGRAEASQAHPDVDVLPEVDDLPIGGDPGDGDGYQPRFLRPGEVLVSRLEGVGEIRQTFTT